MDSSGKQSFVNSEIRRDFDGWPTGTMLIHKHWPLYCGLGGGHDPLSLATDSHSLHLTCNLAQPLNRQADSLVDRTLLRNQASRVYWYILCSDSDLCLILPGRPIQRIFVALGWMATRLPLTSPNGRNFGILRPAQLLQRLGRPSKGIKDLFSTTGDQSL